MTKFAINYNESVIYFGKELKWVVVIGSLHIDEDQNITLEVSREISWQYRDYKSVYNEQYSDEIPPHRSFDHAIDMVDVTPDTLVYTFDHSRSRGKDRQTIGITARVLRRA